jgi:quinol-cytochrome oxidoreductase complex cytochrome b subunit
MIMRHPVLSGLIFGALVYFVMNFIVLPLSGVPHARAASLTLASRINAVLALLFCIGLPISLLVRTTLQRERATAESASLISRTV